MILYGQVWERFLERWPFGPVQATLLATMLILLTVAPHAAAQTVTWSNPADVNWSVGANWVGGAAPTSAANTALVFGSPTTQSATYTATNDIADPFQLNSLTFNNTAGIVTLAGSGLSFVGANPTLTQSGTGAAVINTTVTLAATTTVAGTRTGPVTFNGAVSGGTNNLVKTSAGPITLAGGGDLNVLQLEAGTTNFTNGTLALNLRNNTAASLLLGTAAGQTVVLNQSGGRINFTENARIGNVAGSTATVNVTGAGTVLDNTLAGTTGLMRVGGSGAGILNVTAGGVVNSRNLYVGTLSGSTGEMLIDGAGSTVNSSFMFRVGNSGTGTLVVRNEGVLNAGTVARDFALIVGNTGIGTLTVRDGGTVTSPVAYVGYGGDGGLTGTGALTVSGVGSTLTVGSPTSAGELGIGVTELGTGTLNVQDGGQVTVNGSVRGAYFDGRGTINVTDAGSLLRVTGRLSLGGEFSDSPGTATLNVGSGGTVTVVGRAQLQNASAINLNTGGVMSAGSLADGPRNGNGVVNLAAGTTLSLTNGTDTFKGAIRGEGGLAKTGGGVQTLAGVNTYTGVTTVGMGLLRITGSINTNNAVTVAAPGTLEVQGIASSVGGITGAGVTTVGDGAFPTTLTASHVRQSTLTINAASEVKTRAGGGTSVLNTLSIAGDATPAAKFDLNNNSAIVDYAAAGPNPTITVRDQIIAGRGGAGLGKTWNGQGITSSAAELANATDPESRSVAYGDNLALPLGPYTTFRGQSVDDTSILMAFTRTGDANLDGIVNDDDVTIVGASYAPGVPQPSWALGDFDYNGFVDDDDVTLLGAFYDPSALPLVTPAPTAGGSLAAVPEPGAWTLTAAALVVMVLLTTCRRTRPQQV